MINRRMKRHACFLRIGAAAVLAAGAVALAGCGRRAPNPYADTITQVSTLHAVEAGDVAGKRLVADLAGRGDFGAGYTEGLRAALAVLDGKPLVIAADGSVAPAGPGESTPFATVTFFAKDHEYDVADLTRDVFVKTMDWKRPDTNKAYAIRVTGLFGRIQLETADRPEGLELADTAGTMLGYWHPPTLDGVTRNGYAFLFVDQARARGGVVQDFRLTHGRIEVDESEAFQVLLGGAGTNALGGVNR